VKTIVMSTAVRQAVVAHARDERPLECCGFLVGDKSMVRFAARMENVAASATRFRVDDRAHIELRRALRPFKPPLEIVGVYHSHPVGGPFPSPTDLDEAMYPDWAYVVVGLGGVRPAIRAFHVRQGAAREITIRWRSPLARR
jgi:proteasome lid subunit RPN8/RPN11